MTFRRLTAVFGHMPIAALEPQHAYQYIDKRSKVAATAAIREYEVLSHAFTKAIKWGYINRHPLKGQVVKERPKPRTRYVEDWELVEALKVANITIRCYIAVKLLTGLRRGDLLRMRVSDLKEDGIHVRTRKTDRAIIYEWSLALREAIDTALAARAKDIAPHVFCTRNGEPYAKEDGSANAWDSLWQRFMRKVIMETKVEQRFTEQISARSALRMPKASNAPGNCSLMQTFKPRKGSIGESRNEYDRRNNIGQSGFYRTATS